MEYKPAEHTMVDFAGKKYHYVDEHTGERILKPYLHVRILWINIMMYPY